MKVDERFMIMNENNEKSVNAPSVEVEPLPKAGATTVVGQATSTPETPSQPPARKTRSHEHTRALRQALVADARAGLTREQLAQKYHLKPAYVYAICKSKGIILKKKRPFPEAECLAALRSDMRLAQISAKLHVDYAKLKALVDKYQIDRRRARRQGKTWQVIDLLEKTDLTMEQIGEKMGVTRQRVHQIYQRAVVEGSKFPNRKIRYRTKPAKTATLRPG